MSDQDQITLRQWTDVVRRARLGRTTKAVALLLATYADSDGTRVFPGIARIAIDAEITYNVVQTSLANLRKAGLIQLVRQASRKGDSDEYRLILHPDLLELVEVLTPAQVKAGATAMRDKRRGRDRGADPQPTAWGAGPVDNPEPQPTPWGAQPPNHKEPAPHGVVQNPEPHPTASYTRTPRRDPPPPSTTSPLLPPTPEKDHSTAAPGPRARDPATADPPAPAEPAHPHAA